MLSFSENRSKNMASDCIICAMRPALYLNQINIYQAEFSCRHSIPPSTPHFQSSKFLQALTLLCNCILTYGIYNDISQILGPFTSKHVLIFIEIVLHLSTIIFNFTFLYKNDVKLKESHGLISLIQHKFTFGVSVIFRSGAAKRLHSVSLYLILLLMCEETVTYCMALAMEEVDEKLFIRISMLEILVLSNAALGFYALQALFLYEEMFDRCYNEMEIFLKRLQTQRETGFTGRILIERLQKLQRLYLCLRRNFKLNEDILQPGIIITYSINICLLLIGYGYYSIMFISGEVSLLKFDIYLILKSLVITKAFGYFCYKAQKVSRMSDDILSFLFRCPLSKLNPRESAQIEILISCLILQKPDLNASDIVIVGTGFLASVLGNVLKYLLVALQFHDLWTPN